MLFKFYLGGGTETAFVVSYLARFLTLVSGTRMYLAEPIISRHIIKMKTAAHDLIKASAAGASDAFSVQQHRRNALFACLQPDTYLSRLAAHTYLHASMFWGNSVDFSPFNWMSSVGRKVQKIKCFPERRVGRDSRPCLGETSSRRRLRL